MVYDLRCRTEEGEEFIVEMQKGGQDYFSDRILYYLSRSIATQGYKGKKVIDIDEERKRKVNWDFNLQPVYGVFFLNFNLKGYPPCPLRKIQFTINGTKQVFCDKVRAYTIELPDYHQYKETDCKTKIDYWSYIMTHMETMRTQLPFLNEKPIFNKVADIASVAALKSDELQLYMDSVDAYRTTMATLAYTKNEGREEGREEGRLEERISNAKALKESGLLTNQQICDILHLNLDEVESL